MSWSLGEAEALGRKAARGAGLPWGLAEEAGRALRWLEARGLPGAAALVDALGKVGEGDADRLRAALAGEAPAAPLCPIRLGAALSDFGLEAPPGGCAEVRQPLLLAPFLAAGPPRALTWPGGSVTVAADAVCASGDLLAPAAEVRIAAAKAPEGAAARRTRVPNAAAPHIAALTRLAARTYAPATEASRAGAGAGTTDND